MKTNNWNWFQRSVFFHYQRFTGLKINGYNRAEKIFLGTLKTVQTVDTSIFIEGGMTMTFGMILGLILIPAGILALGVLFYVTTSHYDQETNSEDRKVN